MFDIILIMYLLILIFTSLFKCFEFSDEVTTFAPKDNCRKKHRLITSDKFDKYTFVEIPINNTFILECHYWCEFCHVVLQLN